MSSAERPRVLIVTALQLENDAVLRGLKGQAEWISGVRCFQAEIGAYAATVTCLQGMGNITSASLTSYVIAELRPNAVFLVGIAGGANRPTSEVTTAANHFLGDVLVADQVVDYEFGKQTDSGFEHRFRSFPASHFWLSLAKSLKGSDWSSDLTVSRPDSTTGRVSPCAHVGAFASGEKVIKSKRSVRDLKKVWGQLVGIEMEGLGVAVACHQSSPPTDFFVVKSICDWADPKKDDHWQAYAADTAAAFAKRLIVSARSAVADASDGPPFAPSASPPLNDFDSHLEWLTTTCQREHILNHYVDITCKTDDGRQGAASLEECVNDWLKGDCPILYIIGDFGSGKSWFSLHYAQTTLASGCERTPLVMPLREFTQLGNGAFALPGQGFVEVEQLRSDNGRRPTLLILDGLDEMQGESPEAKLNILLGTLLTTTSKIIVTARESEFDTFEAACAFLKRRHQGNSSVVVKILGFDSNQIRKAIESRHPGKADDYVKRINEIFDLPELATRPVLLQMMCDILPDLYALYVSKRTYKQCLTHADVYERALKRAMARDVTRLGVNENDHAGFLENLAQWGFDKVGLKRRIPQVDALTIAGGTATLLESSLLKSPDFGKHVEFIHSSFQEFLIAKKFAAELKDDTFILF
jgi:nucleoside phosphorylase